MTSTMQAHLALDHLLIGAPSLEMGVAWLERRTGVRAAMGGSHPGLGTWNALASLGPRQYIEIIAPDPGQPGVETFYVPGLRQFEGPRIATWAAAGEGLASRFGDPGPNGFSCGPLRSGIRVRPDGMRLAWTLAFPKLANRGNLEGTIPFFIEWHSESVHPGGSAPRGLTLIDLSIEHPDPDQVRRGFRALGLTCSIRRAKVAAIRAEVETSLGRVVL